MLKISVFTIASKNYLAYVRVLLASVAELHPEYGLYLCLADQVDGYFNPENEIFTVVQAEQIGISVFDDMALRYDIMELNTAVKPFMFQWLLNNTDSDAVIYLDPDIRIYSRFEELEDVIEKGASVVLTPHISSPLEDGKIPNDYNMLQAGVFNLGFIAARRCKEALDFLGWWGRRLMTHAYADFKNNLFTDQRWCDLAPCFLDNLHVLKHPGYNVAYWNLAHRHIEKRGNGIWQSNGLPLAFFHFSGVSGDNKNNVSKYQNRIQWGDTLGYSSLFDEYFNSLSMSGWDETRYWPYSYSQVSGGLVVTTMMRQIYRKAYPDPLPIKSCDIAALLIRLCNEPVRGAVSEGDATITQLMEAIYTQREDLQVAFNIGTSEGRRQFALWFIEAGPREYGLPACVTSNVFEVLTNNGDQQCVSNKCNPLHEVTDEVLGADFCTSAIQESQLTDESCAHYRVGSIHELLSFDGEEFVTCAFITLLDRKPDAEGRLYYLERLNKGIEKIEVISQICRSVEGRKKIGAVSGPKMSAMHRIWLLLPRGLRKSLINAWANIEYSGTQTKNSTMVNSTSDASENGQVVYVSKLDIFDEPADIPQMLGDMFISNLMYLIWLSRPDLQDAFDLAADDGQQGFKVWYQASAQREYGLEPVVPKYSEMQSKLTDNFSYSIQGIDGANLIGYAHAELGMGEHVRMTAAAFEIARMPFGVINFDVGVASRQNAMLDHGEVISGNPYKANIFHVNADAMLLAFCNLGRDFFRHRYNIGYWAWELSKCPDDWMHAISMVNEIWAPSRFIQESFLQKTDIPVEYMPLCVTLPPLRGYLRKHFKLPPKAFVFLYTFDFFSYLDRKNPFAAIKAFKLAFPDRKKQVVLVLKTMNGDENSPLWLKMMEIIDGDDRVVVMNNTLDRDEIIGLFNVCDCFVSLHRSEGFGRGPAEAMYLGKPVIVTNYSGNTDFTHPDNSCLVNFKLIPVEEGQYPFYQGQVWADPDVEHAAWYMKIFFEDHSFAKDIGRKGQAFVHTNFNQNVIGSLYANRLKNLKLI